VRWPPTLVAVSTGWAGEVYRWTDAQGVLHIADVPPPNGHKVETQNLPTPAAHHRRGGHAAAPGADSRDAGRRDAFHVSRRTLPVAGQAEDKGRRTS
jgi:hypothetical protein